MFSLVLFLQKISAVLSTLKKKFAVITETPIKIRKNWNGSKLVLKVLLRKCFPGPIECSVDNTSSKFLLIFQVLLLKIRKCFKKHSRQKNFSYIFTLYAYFLVLTLCATFSVRVEKITQSPKEATYSKFYIYHLFPKCCTGHLNCAFGNHE